MIKNFAAILTITLLLLAGNAGVFAQGTDFRPSYPQPGQPPQSVPNMAVGQPSPIDGYWLCMTPQGPIMMGLQNGMFMMMDSNMQMYGQGTFVIQGQRIISTLANGQQEIFDFQCDGMNLQLRDAKTGAIVAYQKIPNQPAYQQPAPYTQPGYPQTPPQPGQQQQPYPQQMPQQFPQMQQRPQLPQQ